MGRLLPFDFGVSFMVLFREDIVGWQYLGNGDGRNLLGIKEVLGVETLRSDFF